MLHRLDLVMLVQLKTGQCDLAQQLTAHQLVTNCLVDCQTLQQTCFSLLIPPLIECHKPQIISGDALPQTVATGMHQAWIRFVREQDPGWQPYDLERRATMRFDTESELVLNPQAAEREAWAGIR